MEKVLYQDLGNMPYKEAWDYQTGLHQALVAHKLAHRDAPLSAYTQEHRLLLVEHPPVFTLGKSGSLDNLLLSEPTMQERGIDYFPINRGGDITFHGPGQIVGYPILDLERFFTDVHRFVRGLEEVMIRTMAEDGIEGYRIGEYTGVWVQGPPAGPDADPAAPVFRKKRKICAIGVHLSRWVTLHGWAFNVNTALDYFNYIVPCGITDPDKTVTSMAVELGRPVEMAEIKNRIKKHFAAIFDCEIVEPN